ncbi:MAG: alkaline phosphatase [Chlorobi bacterium]|nr:alkaline phosphatase [Chlorobiota bacterium]
MKRTIFFSAMLIMLVIVSGCRQTAESQLQDVSSKVLVSGKKPKNIIFMIGDGMGISQVYAGMTANKGHLNLEKCAYTGLQKTFSASDYITDSAASGTAMASGTKTKNGILGKDTTGKDVKTILEYARDHGLATGLVATSAITHATPASFIAHVKSRNQYEDIARFFIRHGPDVFIGGGRDNFASRKDGENLLDSLKAQGYRVIFSMDSIEQVKHGKLAGLTAPVHNPPMTEGRGNMLPEATATALNILSNDPDGFFIMIEGSQIDWGGHANDQKYVITEMLDFDNAVKQALDFAEKDGNTLVVITADHETGGMALNGGNLKTGKVEAAFTTKGHTAVMVPVFAYGPGAENFTGIYDNTDIFRKFMALYGFSATD